MPPARARHHFFVAPEAFDGATIEFSPEQAHQIARVLRLRSGESVVVLDGRGGEVAARLAVEGQRVRALVEGSSQRCSEPSLRLAIYQAIIRPEHLAWLLQKGTEIGVSRFVLVQTVRSQHGGVPAPAREARLRAIVREAAEQSRRLLVPEVGMVGATQEAIAEIAAGQAHGARGLFLWEGEESRRLRAEERPLPGATINLLVGPEGGWAAEEVALAREAGLEVLSLGPRLLRAETAALMAAAGLLSLSDDLL